jgi:hypothetical protein
VHFARVVELRCRYEAQREICVSLVSVEMRRGRSLIPLECPLIKPKNQVELVEWTRNLTRTISSVNNSVNRRLCPSAPERSTLCSGSVDVGKRRDNRRSIRPWSDLEDIRKVCVCVCWSGVRPTRPKGKRTRYAVQLYERTGFCLEGAVLKGKVVGVKVTHACVVKEIGRNWRDGWPCWIWAAGEKAGLATGERSEAG